MTNLARQTDTAYEIGERYGFEREKVELIKSQIAQGASDGELALFLYTAQRVGLDPLAKQIYCIMRTDRGQQKMTIQTGIDGYRLIADRTGNYAPGRANTFEYDDQARLVSATAYVMKHVRGAWLETSATAYWDEYVALNRDGQPQNLWKTKPRVMLGKCAEALALRRAFPAELSGIYTNEEMGAAGNGDGPIIVQQPAVDTSGIVANILRLQAIVAEHDTSVQMPTRETLQSIEFARLSRYHTRLIERVEALRAVSVDPEPDDDEPLFSERDEALADMSAAERAFWDAYEHAIGNTWTGVQKFLGHILPRPATDEDWADVGQLVNARLTEEDAARGQE